MKNREAARPLLKEAMVELPQTAQFLLRQIVTAGAGFAFAQAVIFESFSPFGVAFVAAAPRDSVLAAAFGAALGYLVSQSGGAMPLRYIAALLAVLVIGWALNGIEKMRRKQVFLPLAAFGGCLVTGLAMAVAQGFTATRVATYFAEAVLAGGTAYFFYHALRLPLSGRRLQGLKAQQTACLLVTAGLLLMALSFFEIGGIAPARIVTVFLVLLAAQCGREAAGSVTGVAAGVAMSLTPGMEHLAAGYAFGGLLAGVFSPMGQFGTAAAFVAANGIVAVVLEGSAASIHTLIEVAVASVLFVLVPKGWIAKVRERTSVRESTVKQGDGLRRALVMRLNMAARAMGEVSDSVDAVSESLRKLCAPNLTGVYSNVHDQVCDTCGLRSFCWEHNFNDTMNVFNDMSTLLRGSETLSRDNIPQHFAQRCIRLDDLMDSYGREYANHIARMGAERSITEMRCVVADQFGGVSDMLADLSEQFDEAQVFDEEHARKVRETLASFEIHTHDVSCLLDPYGRMVVEAHCPPIEARVNRAELTRALNQSCGRVFDAPCVTIIGEETLLTFSERATLTARVGTAQYASGGAALCGDSFECFNDGRGRQLLVISDGMGTGGRAAVDGAMAAGLLARLVKAGFGFDCALRVVNSALLVKSVDESLATLDIVCIDLFSGRADFYKAGAPASYVRHKGKAARLELSSLPAGILREVSFAKASTMAEPGDVILLVSDGVLNGDDAWICAELESFQDGTPAQLAERITQEARRRRLDGHEDDVTVLAALLAPGV